MKNFLAGLLLGVILLGFGMLVYLRLGLVGVRADAPVPHWVARLLYTGIHAFGAAERFGSAKPWACGGRHTDRRWKTLLK